MMSLESIIHSVQNILDEGIPSWKMDRQLMLSRKFTIRRKGKCRPGSKVCHRFDRTTKKKQKWLGYNCSCQLIKCVRCDQLFWNEEEGTNYVCYACEDEDEEYRSDESVESNGSINCTICNPNKDQL